jgi:serine/threonine-protein kinase
MTLASGTRLGSFEIVDSLGAGGMGEVWRARDTALNREVALKVLPAAVINDAERLTRFRREAHVLAALNHPNIASIYGFEEGHGTPALVLELVEGPTLDERIARGAIPVDDALPIAKQIALAIEAAHERGIVHRDLKPSNIKVRRDGTVKVLDFGLAKAFEPVAGPGIAATLTSPAMTVAGVILGTAAYMSPEQARGEVADERADVWAFGCVLFEMLTGERLFDGRTVTDVLAAVLRADPPWDRLPSRLHPRLRMLLERCLERDPRDRYHSIADARVDVDKAMTTPSPTEALSSVATPARRAGFAAALLVAAAIAAAVAWMLKPSAAAPVTRLSYVLPADQSFTQNIRSLVAFAPDGTSFAYIADSQIFLRRLDSFEAIPIRGTEGTPSTPVFSPDSRSLVFWDSRDEQIRRVTIDGGTPLPLAHASAVYGMSWAPGGVLYAQEDGIWKVNADGGTPERIVAIEASQRVHGPQLLPDGVSLLFTLLSRAQGAGAGAWDQAEIVVQSADGRRQALVTGSDGFYVPTGHLVFARGTVLYAMRFDPESLSVRGGPVPVIEGLQRAVRTPGSSAAANFAISDTGTLAYANFQVALGAVPRSLVAVDRTGRSEPLLDEQRDYWRPRVSRDGTRVAVELQRPGGGGEIWIADLAQRAASPLAVAADLNVFAAWGADDRSIVFRSNRGGAHGVFRQGVAGTEDAVLIVRTLAEPIVTDVSRDGVILLAEGSQSAARAIKTIVDGELTDFLSTPAMEHMAVFSPDGRWVAYASNESGRDEVYLRPFPRSDGIGRRVSIDGGTAPMWARDAAELYFRSAAGDLMAVPITHTTPELTVGQPRALFRFIGQFRISGNAAAYDVLPDGRFLMVTEPASPIAEQRSEIKVVQNWFAELERRVP